METSPEKWKAVKALFEAALEMDSSARSAFLRDHCASEEDRAEVERLLGEHDQAGTFLSTPFLEHLSPEHNRGAAELSKSQLLAGRFRIIRFIAGGGMGQVYEAEDQELHERVAIKTIRQEILAHPNAVARFKREVQMARKVTHRNVCRIFDLFRDKVEAADGMQGETVFISMELLNGETLASQFKQGAMSIDDALPLIEQMASALAAAHAVGVVHRDFKTANVVLVEAAGQVGKRAVVTDFGLALQPLVPHGSASFSTGPGLLGTPEYMAPEQLEGKPATVASDNYALGLVIYEMVTGVRPFPGQGDTSLSTALRRLWEPPVPPRKVCPQLSPAWEEVILRCLRRDPGERFSHAEQIAAALRDRSAMPSAGATRRAADGARMSAPAGARWRSAKVVIAVAMAVLVLAGGLYFRSREKWPLTEKDTLVLADFSNRTGDPAFDDVLKTALVVSLRQSPFLSLLSDDSVSATLKWMMRPPQTPLTAELTRELCVQAHATAYIAGSIAVRGSEFVVALKATNCQSRETLAQEQVTATSKEKVLDALGVAASKLRGQLGESLATLNQFDVPLGRATTSSLGALKAYSRGDYERSIELDPDFALGYWMAANTSTQDGVRRKYLTRAFQLREHCSERDKLVIAGYYYHDITGELDKAQQSLQQLVEDYPRLQEFEGVDVSPHAILGAVYMEEGRYQEAEKITRQNLQFAPHRISPYLALSINLLGLQRLDQARQNILDAQARKLDPVRFHNVLYALGFLSAHYADMTEQQQWFAAKPGYENWGLALAADTQAYFGHLHRARDFTKQAVDAAIRADSRGSAADYQYLAAQREAAFGNPSLARQAATQAFKLSSTSPGVEREAALAFAMANDSPRAEKLAQDLETRFPLHSQTQLLWVPTIRAQLALNNKRPDQALDLLRTAQPIELGQTGFVLHISCLYPIYVRGEAYLLQGQGTLAAAEFQKILDHNGIVWNCWTGAMAQLGVARANALQLRSSRAADADVARSRAVAAYKAFLARWSDADADIPILKEAKAEYAKLQ
jgi:eukaryotic-like serine/threonine-protein kinase